MGLGRRWRRSWSWSSLMPQHCDLGSQSAMSHRLFISEVASFHRMGFSSNYNPGHVRHRWICSAKWIRSAKQKPPLYIVKNPHWLYHIFANLHQGSAESTENSHLGLIWRGTWYNVLFLVLRLFMHSKAVWVYSFEIALGAVEHCPAMRTDIVLLKSCSCQKLCSTSVTSKYSRRSTLHLEPHCWQCGGLL